MNNYEDGLIKVNKTYTTILNGRPVVIHNVPMLQDPDTEETFLAPDTAEKLYDLLRHPDRKAGVVSADVYEWQNGAQVNA